MKRIREEIRVLTEHKQMIESCLDLVKDKTSYVDLNEFDSMKKLIEQLSQYLQKTNANISAKESKAKIIQTRIKIIKKLIKIFIYIFVLLFIFLHFQNYGSLNDIILFIMILILFFLIFIKNNVLLSIKKFIFILFIPLALFGVIMLFPTLRYALNEHSSVISFLSLMYAILLPYFELKTIDNDKGE